MHVCVSSSSGVAGRRGPRQQCRCTHTAAMCTVCPSRCMLHHSLPFVAQPSAVMDEFADIVGNSSSDSAPEESHDGSPPATGAQPQPGGRGRPVLMMGALRIFLVVSSATAGYWQGAFAMDGVAGGIAEGAVVGAVLARWHMRRADEPADTDSLHMHRLAAGVVRATTPVPGFIDYPIEASAIVREFRVPPSTVPAVVLAACSGISVHTTTPDGQHGDESLSELLRRWTAAGALPAIVVCLATPLALKVVTGSFRVLHSVALTQRVSRSRLLLQADLSSKRCCSAWRRFGGGLPLVPAARRRLSNQVPAEVHLDWIKASRDLTSLWKVKRTTAAFSKVFGNAAGLDPAALLQKVRISSRELLRRDRVRIDVVAMLASREAFARMIESGRAPHCHILCDASPQHRGLELFAASWDVVHDQIVERRLFPLLRIGRTQLDTAGKLSALLWQIYLVSASSVSLFLAFCRSVRSITTDMGVERRLVDRRNCIRRFLRRAFPSARLPEQVDIDKWLFPRALLIPGWRHCFDGVLRRGLSGLPWFPAFLEKLKSLISFFRDYSMTDELARKLREAHLPGLAEAIQRLRLTSIAEWRWCTLGAACDGVGGIMESLVQHFDHSWCSPARDAKRSRHVSSALTDPTWQAEFRLIRWICGWIDPIAEWIGGCACHAAEFAGGRTTNCPQKGRRLAEAFPFGMQALREGLEIANHWTVQEFSGNHVLLQNAQGAVRDMYHSAARRLEFLDGLPWALARLLQPGVKARCLALWAAAPENQHHRVSVEFLSEHGDLRWRIDLLDESGGGGDEVLRAAVNSLCSCPMDDAAAEGPHAQIKRIKLGTPAAAWPWQAATARLDQNLKDMDNLQSMTRRCSAHTIWVSLSAGGAARGREEPGAGT